MNNSKIVNIDNLENMLTDLGFTKKDNIYIKNYEISNCCIKVNFDKKQIEYPEDKGMQINERQTCNFKNKENFVVLECVNSLLGKGYLPEHIILEPKWKLGHGASGGRADILIRDNKTESLFIIECKTYGKEFDEEWENMKNNGGQLFSYAQQARSTKFLVLYTSYFNDNNSIDRTSNIISLKDIDQYEGIDDLRTYSKATSANELYDVWKNTYKFDYETHGIFEKNVRAYEIGKNKYSVDDLKDLDNSDIQKKYNEFATILRQHNVSGRENAFDKLINLFLAKIVDETQNPDDLQFFWKGQAYDDYFSLQDRIQKLYKDGMRKFLDETVTYIDDKTINDTFRLFQNDPDATKDAILKYFKELKFFTNNDFAFLDVHNEKLFYQNSEILLKIVKMLQDIKLKTESQNQFLGDLFEGFLDQGIKQSEGQFFTPMPIVKFLVSSLPIKEILKNNSMPYVIDFACGAGHFLNEYATQIKPYVSSNELKEYYNKIYGIEKEYRLSKVAKVSAFMYGQDEINIIYGDALTKLDEVNDSKFSILIANPPYSVKGFLETLSENQRNKYELYKEIDNKNLATINSIETFFIERAKQLLEENGVAAIILPASVLNKSNNLLYVKTRELIIKYFDIVAISEFGSATFGKTGTNTVTLFLRRKKYNPSLADHYENRVNSWFDGDFDKDIVFEDRQLIEAYCKHINIDEEAYFSLMTSSLDEKLMNINIFKDYYATFENLSEIKNLKIRKTYKNLSEVERKEILRNKFMKYVKSIEKEKLYYFMLAYMNPQPVLIVKSPSDTNEIKKYLGYEWSDKKGNEGIKPVGAIDFSEDDGEILNKKGLDNISTPLYNPNNLFDDNKINTLIRNNFNFKKVLIPDDLKKYVSQHRLIDMISFDRVIFNKEINLSFIVDKVESKFEKVKLGEICICKGGNTFSKQYQGGKNEKDIAFLKVSDMNLIENYSEITKANNYVDEDTIKTKIKSTIFEKDTVIFPKVGRAIDTNKKRILNIKACIDNNTMAVNVKDKNEVLPKYIYYYFESYIVLKDIASNSNPPSISAANLNQLNIPKPPIEVQQKIVDECKKIDDIVKDNKLKVSLLEKQKKDKINDIFYRNFEILSISEVSCKPVEYGTSEKSIKNGKVPVIGMGNIQNGKIILDNLVYTNNEDVISKYKLNYNDVLFNRTNSPEHVGKVGIYQSEEEAVFAGYLIRINYNKELINPMYLTYILNSENVRNYGYSIMSKSINQANISGGKLKEYKIPVPSLSIQNDFVDELKEIENEIEKYKEIINNQKEEHKIILSKYL